jgi:hypothetical protein
LTENYLAPEPFETAPTRAVTGNIALDLDNWLSVQQRDQCILVVAGFAARLSGSLLLLLSSAWRVSAFLSSDSRI